MSEEEKEAIEILKDKDVLWNNSEKKVIANIDIVLNLIEKQNKVIDKMAQEIFIEYNPHFSTPEQVKEYFYKEIENE